jgi:hypothetical protein
MGQWGTRPRRHAPMCFPINPPIHLSNNPKQLHGPRQHWE